MIDSILFMRAPAAWACLLAVFLSGCNPPKYATYTSVRGDWRASVPWGWNVMTDQEGAHYSNTTFIGPFEPEFYLGVPSLSVRWYGYSLPRRLPDGLLEMYASAEDYYAQVLKNVYGPEPLLRRPLHEVEVAGRRAKHFVVLSPLRVPKGALWGTALDADTGRLVNLREHAYVLLPLKRGFYVLIYPATRDGFKLYEPQFNQLVNSFAPLQEGPGGPKPEAPAAASSPREAFGS